MAVFLVGAFILVNYCLDYRNAHQPADPMARTATDQLPPGLEGRGRRLSFHDFESGNAGDTASHLVDGGHGGTQSLKMSPAVPFSPGLWITFRELDPGDSSWIRATGYVWFSCPDSLVKCSLVATCNHRGVNYKYMFVPLEKQHLVPNRWNRVSIDYRIPLAPDTDDALQAYFWYRGRGEMLVDDVAVEYYKALN